MENATAAVKRSSKVREFPSSSSRDVLAKVSNVRRHTLVARLFGKSAIPLAR